MIKYKEIIIGNKKICKICDKSNNSGIIVRENSICESCVQSIVDSDISSKDYNILVDKIKNIIF